MQNFYQYAAGAKAHPDFELLKRLGEGLKVKKNLVIDGFYTTEYWEQRSFAWASEQLSFWFEPKDTVRHLIVISRGDVLSEDVLKSRLTNASCSTNLRDAVSFNTDSLTNGDALIRIELQPHEEAISIKFGQVVKEGSGLCVLSLPITSVLALNEISTFKAMKTKIEFFNLAQLIDSSFGYGHFFSAPNDAMADCFIRIMEEDLK